MLTLPDDRSVSTITLYSEQSHIGHYKPDTIIYYPSKIRMDILSQFDLNAIGHPK